MPAKTANPLNLHAVRNGARISRLVLGELPKTWKRQLAGARKYRRDLEQAVAEIKDEVSVWDAHLIDEAVGAEVHASICRWIMRNKLDEMSVSDLLKCSEQIMKSRTARNKAVEQLGLRGQERDVVAILYADPADTPPTSPRVASEGEGPAPDTSPEERPTQANVGDDPEEEE